MSTTRNAVRPRPENWSDHVALVTGATGFLGSHLVRRLVSHGANVHALTRYTQPDSATFDDSVTIHAADVTDARAIHEVLATARPSIVFHLAAYGTRPDQSDTDLMERVNVLGTLRLLDACHASGRPLVVYPSSCSESTLAASLREPDQRMMYSATKVAAWGICRAYRQEGIVPCIIAKLFTAYGAGEPEHRLIPSVARSLLRDEAPRVTSGEQKRDFVYVDDLIEGLMAVALAPQAAGQTVELGTGQAVAVRDIVEMLVRISGRPVQPEYGAVEKRSDDGPILQADPNAAYRVAGWRARTSLEDGLLKAWAWHERMYAGETARSITSRNAR